MRKKPMLVAGALSALALAALPAAASAGEYPTHCITETCSSTIAGPHLELRTTGGSLITCTSSTGTISQANHSTTGTAQFTFHGCKDPVFGTHCGNAGTGTIKTNTLTSHNVYLEPSGSRTPGVLFTGMNMTVCGFFGAKTVSGGIIGHWENPNCGVTQNSHWLSFEEVSAGHQRFKQVTTTGPVYDLIAKEGAGVPETFSVASTETLSHANSTALTC
ncbi:MAG TPA: hypothetical protein VIT89_03740 [Solirubrobacterales bacterium]